MDRPENSGPTFVDLFCGGGFGARGAVRGGGQPLLGIDAWDLAARTYKRNFPGAEVLAERIQDVDIEELAARFRPDVLLTSPECTAHSIARGARPGLEYSRESALGIVPWITHFSPRWIIVENVNRMKLWERHDELVKMIEQKGYVVSDLFLNAADFGSAQARKRLFLICDREGSVVSGSELIAFASKKVRTARDIIDWTEQYPSQPLHRLGRARATLERAERAMSVLGRQKPFLIVYYGSDYAGGWQSVDAPLRTVTTIDRFGLVTWAGNRAYLRMLQPLELAKAMGARSDHRIPYGNRREQVKLCGNGVCSEVMTSIFKWIAAKQNSLSASCISLEENGALALQAQ